MLMSVTVALSGVLNGWFKTEGFWKQLVSWIVGSALSCGAWGLKLIEFGEPVWVGVVALCVVVGLSSNGIYDIPAIRSWIEKWFKR